MKAASYEEVVQDERCVVHGELQQQKRKVGTWIPRYCAVWDNQFLCYKTEAEIKPQVVFRLEGFQVEKCTGSYSDQPFCFQLSKPGVVDHMFATDSQTSLNKWLQKLLSSGVKNTKVQEQEDAQGINEKSGEEHPQNSSKANGDSVDGGILDRLLKRNSSKQDSSVKLASFRPLDVDAPPGVAGSAPLQSSQSFNNKSRKSDGVTTHLRRSREIEDLLDAEEEASVNQSDYPSISSVDDFCSVPNTADSAESGTEGFFDFTLEPEQREGRSKSFLEEVLQALGGEANGDKSETQSNKPEDETASNQEDVKENTNESSTSNTVESTTLASELPVDKPNDSVSNSLSGTSKLTDPKQAKETSSAILDEPNTSDLLDAVNALNIFVKEHDVKETEKTISDLIEDEPGNKSDQVDDNSISSQEDSAKVVLPTDFIECGPDVTNTTPNKDISHYPPDVIENANNSVDSQKHGAYLDVDFLNFEPNNSLEDDVFSDGGSNKNLNKDSIPLTNLDGYSNDGSSRSRSESEKSRTSSIYKDLDFRDLHARSTTPNDTNSDMVTNVSVQKLRQMFNQKPSSENLNHLLKPKQPLSENTCSGRFEHKSRQKTNTRNATQRSKSVPVRKVTKSIGSASTTDDMQWLNGGILLTPVIKTPTPSVSSYVNITFQASSSATWERRWAVLFPHGIYFHEMAGDSRVIFILSTRGLTLEPCALETGRVLAFKIVRKQRLEMVMEPDDVEDLGRWVSGLFRVIQQPAAPPEEHQPSAGHDRPLTPQPTPTPVAADEADMVLLQQEEAVSVKEMRAVFESAKPSSPGHTPFSSSTSLLSSPPPSTASPAPPYSRSISSSPAPPPTNSSLARAREEQASPISASSEDSIANYKRMQASMMKMGDKYADVVCWLGRYIEQDQEKEVLSGVANPFLAKLRMRHKLETVARLEGTATEMEKNIANLKERLSAKEQSKNKVGEQPRGRLIRNAEDARRTEDDKKRIDRECATIRSRIKETESQLSQVLESIDSIQIEIQEAYEQFDWTKHNQQDHALNGQNGHGSDHTTDDEEEELHIPSTEGMPEWTKKAKEKAMAWKMKADAVH